MFYGECFALISAVLWGTIPLVTITLSHFLLKELERVTRFDIVGTVLIVLGVVLLLG
jgi:drug/metabolite transporter (DMT)-like permease